MTSDVFELISKGFRYWFVLLGVIIVWRTFRWTLQDHRTYRRVLKALPDAGLIGEIVNLNAGDSQSLPREGVIGSGKSCDVRLSGIRRRELEYLFIDGRGVEIRPAHRRHELLLDDRDIAGRAFAAHGSRLTLPGYFLRFRLFSGLNVPEVTPESSHNPQDENLFSSNIEYTDLSGVMPYPDQLPGLHENLMPQTYMQSERGYMNEPSVPVTRDWNPDLTWQYAVPPPEVFAAAAKEASYPQLSQPVWENEYQQAEPKQRKRRSKRHEN